MFRSGGIEDGCLLPQQGCCILQVFAMDIHPQAKFGKGILMDHGTGIVVGQTAVVGNNVSILQNVTLGGEPSHRSLQRRQKLCPRLSINASPECIGRSFRSENLKE